MRHIKYDTEKLDNRILSHPQQHQEKHLLVINCLRNAAVVSRLGLAKNGETIKNWEHFLHKCPVFLVGEPNKPVASSAVLKCPIHELTHQFLCSTWCVSLHSIGEICEHLSLAAASILLVVGHVHLHGIALLSIYFHLQGSQHLQFHHLAIRAPGLCASISIANSLNYYKYHIFVAMWLVFNIPINCWQAARLLYPVWDHFIGESS